MKKRNFLVPVAVTLAALTGSAKADLVQSEGISGPDQVVNSVDSLEVQKTIGEDFVIAPNDGEGIETAYHRSHMSHRSHISHSSHRSHYSSYR